MKPKTNRERKGRDVDKDTVVAYHEFIQGRIQGELNGVTIGPGYMLSRIALASFLFGFACLITGILVISLRHRHVYLVDWNAQFLGPFFIVLFLMCCSLSTWLLLLAKRRTNQYRADLAFRPIGDYGVAVVHKSKLAYEDQNTADLKTATTRNNTRYPGRSGEDRSNRGDYSKSRGYDSRGYTVDRDRPRDYRDRANDIEREKRRDEKEREAFGAPDRRDGPPERRDRPPPRGDGDRDRRRPPPTEEERRRRQGDPRRRPPDGDRRRPPDDRERRGPDDRERRGPDDRERRGPDDRERRGPRPPRNPEEEKRRREDRRRYEEDKRRKLEEDRRRAELRKQAVESYDRMNESESTERSVDVTPDVHTYQVQTTVKLSREMQEADESSL